MDIIQIITGLLLTIHYSSSGITITYIYYSLYLIIREIYYGWSLRYFHSNIPSFLFIFLYLHIIRSLLYSSYHSNTFISGLLLYLLLMAISFIGYVLPFGQMSLWGATVITNLLSFLPSLISFLIGNYTISTPTIKRFFILHFLLPFLLILLLAIHIFYLHYHSSNNPLTIITNNKISFYPYLLNKDLYSFTLLLSLLYIQSIYTFIPLSHPDNSLLPSTLNTPLHIVPEWYFLSQYSILKSIPNKNTGFIFLLSSILFLLFFLESSSISTLTKLYFHSNYFTISTFIYSYLILLLIGGQFPLDIFLSYARILTLYYYFLLMSILIQHSWIKRHKWK